MESSFSKPLQDLGAVEVFKALVTGEMIEYFKAHHLTDCEAGLVGAVVAAGARQQMRPEGTLEGGAEVVYLAEYLH